jgi:hypothetical protein
MKNTKTIVVAIVAVIILFAVFIFRPADDNKQVAPSEPTVTPVTSTITPSKYSADLKAKVRSEFINTCHTKGKYSVEVCTCGADYLSANYSETDLAKMYLDYHQNNITPKALEIAAEKCTK